MEMVIRNSALFKLVQEKHYKTQIRSGNTFDQLLYIDVKGDIDFNNASSRN